MTAQGSWSARTLPPPSILPSASPNSVGTPVEIDFAARYPACLSPCYFFNASPAALRRPAHMRGQVVCYSFPVGLFHSLFHAGLSRRTQCSSVANNLLETLILNFALLSQPYVSPRESD